MKIDNALSAFLALSQETRLKVFKILVEYGATGTAAGIISDRLGIPLTRCHSIFPTSRRRGLYPHVNKAAR